MPESDAFQDAIADIFADDSFRDAAVLTRLAGGTVACNVHFGVINDPQPNGFQSQLWRPQYSIEADYSVVGDLYPGDIFAIASGLNVGSWSVTQVIEKDNYTISVTVKSA